MAIDMSETSSSNSDVAHADDLPGDLPSTENNITQGKELTPSKSR